MTSPAQQEYFERLLKLAAENPKDPWVLYQLELCFRRGIRPSIAPDMPLNEVAKRVIHQAFGEGTIIELESWVREAPARPFQHGHLTIETEKYEATVNKYLTVFVEARSEKAGPALVHVSASVGFVTHVNGKSTIHADQHQRIGEADFHDSLNALEWRWQHVKKRIAKYHPDVVVPAFEQIAGGEALVVARTIERARTLATCEHDGQKYGSHPYTKHLEAVVDVLSEFHISRYARATRDIHIAAWLHDAIEDTAVSFTMIKFEFGEAVADLVWSVTDEFGRNRKERKAKTNAKLMEASEQALILKLADRIANVRSARYGTPPDPPRPDLLQMYRDEYGEFRKTYQRFVEDKHTGPLVEMARILPSLFNQ